MWFEKYFKKWLVLIAFLSAPLLFSQEMEELLGANIQELMNMEITSAARKPEKASETAAAVYVLTREDIQKAGFLSIPDALRAVPGLQVSRINNNYWAISSRGFSNIFSDKLLVMIDGRSVYTPLFGGVFWDVQDVLIDDIDRIEIIRGPGGTMWGSNAVNGVINIITRQASETVGNLVSAHTGNEERLGLAFRHGGKIDDELFYRFYGKVSERDDSAEANGDDAHDDRENGRIGFRMDWDISADYSLTLDTSMYHNRQREYFTVLTLAPPFFENIDNMSEAMGGHMLMSLSHQIDADSYWELKSYYDRTKRRHELFDESRDTFDLDFLYNLHLGNHELLMGGGYRYSSYRFSNTDAILLRNPRDYNQLYNVFVQDEISLIKDELQLIVGCKAEHNDFSGWEVQPSVRTVWMPNSEHTFWASVSRAVQTPSVGLDGITFNYIVPNFPFPPIQRSAVGNSSAESTDLLAFELGHRTNLTPNLRLDTALFFNDYRYVKSYELVTPNTFQYLNNLNAETYGGEIVMDWQAYDTLKIQANYSLLFVDMHAGDSATTDSLETYNENTVPRNQFTVRADFQVTTEVDFTTALYYVDSLPEFDVSDYYRFDVKLGWKPSENLDFSFVVQNLLDDQHLEYDNETYPGAPAMEVERSYYIKMNYRF